MNIDLTTMTTSELEDLQRTILRTITERTIDRQKELAKQYAEAVLAIKKEFPYLGALYGYTDYDGTELDFIRCVPDTLEEIMEGFEF